MMSRNQFLAKHERAEERSEWLQFQTAAWNGSGGFAPVYTPQEELPTGAEPPTIAASRRATGTYLAKHEREDWEDFESRIAVARYPNHLRRDLRHWLGLLLRRDPTVKGETSKRPEVARFLARATPKREPMAAVRRQGAQAAVLKSVALALVDRAKGEDGDPFVTLLDPATLWDWEIGDDGSFDWVKIVEKVTTRVSPWDAVSSVLRARVYTRDVAQVWYLEDPEGDAGAGNSDPWQEDDQPDVTHGLGVVPVAVLTFDDSEASDSIFSSTPADELGQIGREDFNDLSRLQELHEKTCFTTMVVPCETGTARRVMSELHVGPACAVPIDKDSGQSYAILSPPDGPIVAGERKRDANRAEGLRVMGLETLVEGGNAATSSLSRQYETEHRNAELGRFAYRVAEWEKQIVVLVLRFHGASAGDAETLIAAYSVEWPDDYGVRDRQADVVLALQVLDMPGLDPWTRAALVRQTSEAVAQLDAEEKDHRDKWLTAQVEAATVDRAADDKTAQAAAAADALLTDSDMASIVTVNEGRANQGLGPLMDANGQPDPDGALTVEQFRAKRAPKPAAPPAFPPAAPTEQAEQQEEPADVHPLE